MTELNELQDRYRIIEKLCRKIASAPRAQVDLGEGIYSSYIEMEFVMDAFNDVIVDNVKLLNALGDYGE